MSKKGRIIKPLGPQEVPEYVPPRDQIDLSRALAHKTYQKASLALSKIPGGFQKFVIARDDGMFVPVIMLWPTEFTPDIINHCQRLGAHVMVGQATGLTAYQRGE